MPAKGGQSLAEHQVAWQQFQQPAVERHTDWGRAMAQGLGARDQLFKAMLCTACNVPAVILHTASNSGCQA
jgi:hypothetical protein